MIDEVLTNCTIEAGSHGAWLGFVTFNFNGIKRVPLMTKKLEIAGG